MAKRNRYKEMERYMTYVLLGEAAVFLLYLLVAGLGIGWMKVTLAIIAILAGGLCLAYLYMTQELLRKRSLWMSVGFASVIVCLLFSLILNYPAPGKAKAGSTDPSGASGEPVSTAVYIDSEYHF